MIITATTEQEEWATELGILGLTLKEAYKKVESIGEGYPIVDQGKVVGIYNIETEPDMEVDPETEAVYINAAEEEDEDMTLLELQTKIGTGCEDLIEALDCFTGCDWVEVKEGLVEEGWTEKEIAFLKKQLDEKGLLSE